MPEKPPEGLPDLKSQYTEGGSALRHYSVCVLNLRAVTLAQGLTLLTGSVFLLREGTFIPAAVASAFGVAFTLALAAMQRSYWRGFDSILDILVQIEEKCELPGPWTSYKRVRDEAYKQFWWKLLVKHGPYWLLWVAFLLVMGVAAAGQSGYGATIDSIFNGTESASAQSAFARETARPMTT